eukprot:scaffold90296_cov68-Phaeocystis_antarctica.AAC.6
MAVFATSPAPEAANDSAAAASARRRQRSSAEGSLSRRVKRRLAERSKASRPSAIAPPRPQKPKRARASDNHSPNSRKSTYSAPAIPARRSSA